MSLLAQPEEEEQEQRVFKDVSTSLCETMSRWLLRERAAHNHPENTADIAGGFEHTGV